MRANRLRIYDGYTVNQAGQVLVDAGQVFDDPRTLAEALRVAKRAQEIRRLTSRQNHHKELG